MLELGTVKITFQQLGGPMLGQVILLNVWYSHFAFADGDETIEFEQLAPIVVGADGTFSLNITDSLFTLSTILFVLFGELASVARSLLRASYCMRHLYLLKLNPI